MNSKASVEIKDDLFRQFLCQRLYFHNQIEASVLNELNELPGWNWSWTDWDEKIYQLYEYYLENQHYPDSGPLGEWIEVLNSQYFNAKLDEKQFSKISFLPNWEWNQDFNLEKKPKHIIRALMNWNRCYTAILSFLDEHDRLPFGQETFQGINLGEWIRTQRQRKRSKAILQDQIQKLESLPNWTWNAYDKAWNENFQKVLNGTQTNKSWLTSQRRYYKQGKLLQDQIQKLESLPNWTWNPLATHIDARIADLIDFIKEFDRLPKKEEWYRNKKIGSWCNKKRTQYKKGLLPKSEINKLNSIKKWTWTKLDDHLNRQWRKDYQNLLKFIKRNGRLPYKSDGSIGQWVNRQHQRKRLEVMAEEQIRALEDIPQWIWNPRDVIWQQRYQELINYVLNP